MENENMLDAGASSYQNAQLVVSPIASGYLNETGKWGKFLAIVGFCFIGLVIIGGLFAGTIISMMGSSNPDLPFPGFLMGVIYIVMGLLYFFPVYYLFKFSTNLKAALLSKNNQLLDSAFENLKSHYKYVGIMMIVVICIYVLFGLGALLIGGLLGGLTG
ncbi:MAG: DUF5362 family protein [Cyclobacteriaceae bacterium]